MIVDIRSAKEVCKIIDELKIWHKPIGDAIMQVYDYVGLEPKPKPSDLISDGIDKLERYLESKRGE